MQRLESVVTAYGTEVGRYGSAWGCGPWATEPRRAQRRVSGHITLTLIDPVGKLVVSVLTNAVDGPAEDVAVGLVKLIDVALKPRAEVAPPPADSPPLQLVHRPLRQPLGCRGRRRPGWSAGAAPADGDDPLPTVEELEVVDATTLRVAAQPSFGPAGELVPLERDAAGSIVALRLGE